MTFITITTIGFGEVHPLSAGGRLLTMLVAGGGIGSLFYTFTVLLEWAASDEVRAARRERKMQDTIEAMSGHYVIAGYGRVGREAAAELIASRVPVVVVDPSDDSVALALARGFPTLKGDATEDQTLRATGITRAKGLIVTTANDGTNIYVVLSARLISPTLFIAARAADDHSVPKLERAGANRAISPYAIGGRRLAHLMLRPRAVDFLDVALNRGNTSLSIGEVLIRDGEGAAGKLLDALDVTKATGATVLAVIQGPDGAIVIPRPGLVLGAGDHLLALGTDEQLGQLERLVT
jgi:voltage-gated potassium channel